MGKSSWIDLFNQVELGLSLLVGVVGQCCGGDFTSFSGEADLFAGVVTNCKLRLVPSDLVGSRSLVQVFRKGDHGALRQGRHEGFGLAQSCFEGHSAAGFIGVRGAHRLPTWVIAERAALREFVVNGDVELCVGGNQARGIAFKALFHRHGAEPRLQVYVHAAGFRVVNLGVGGLQRSVDV